MAWEIATLVFIGINALSMALIGLGLLFLGLLKQRNNSDNDGISSWGILFSLIGIVFLFGSLLTMYGGYGYGYEVIDSNNPANETLVLDLYSSTMGFHAVFYMGAIALGLILVFLFLIILLYNTIKGFQKRREDKYDYG